MEEPSWGGRGTEKAEGGGGAGRGREDVAGEGEVAMVPEEGQVRT